MQKTIVVCPQFSPIFGFSRINAKLTPLIQSKFHVATKIDTIAAALLPIGKRLDVLVI
jgi:hypothetical protein